jgi:hypothetical protein
MLAVEVYVSLLPLFSPHLQIQGMMRVKEEVER